MYQPDNEIKLEVRLEDETVWLTQAQIVELFQSSKANISEHIKNIYEQGELEASSTVRDFRTVRQEGGRQVARIITYYNLDAIISIGFRVNTKRGIQFRRWANCVLKEYLLKGHVVNSRLEQIDTRLQKHERQIEYLTDKVDFCVRTSRTVKKAKNYFVYSHFKISDSDERKDGVAGIASTVGIGRRL